MGVEVAKPDAGRRNPLQADLGLNVRILTDIDDGVVQHLQDVARRLGRRQKTVPGRVDVIDVAWILPLRISVRIVWLTV
jgi:hypothetical protein